MVDPQNNDALLLLVGLIEHPVRTAPGKPDPGQFAAQRPSHPSRCSQQVPREKLRDRGGDPLGQPIQGALRGGRYQQARVRHRGPGSGPEPRRGRSPPPALPLAWTLAHDPCTGPATALRAVPVWSCLHGLVSLEIAGNFAAMGIDPDQVFEAQLVGSMIAAVT